MHDLYYKGRIHTRVNHVKSGYNTKRDVRLGTSENPLSLTVTSEERKNEVSKLVEQHELVADISVSSDSSEDINQLMALINTASTTTFEKTPGRNDPCSCNSGKKFKKCCG